jgi:hypothetical protein
LGYPAADQHDGTRCQTGEQGRGSEDTNAGKYDSATAEQVGAASAEQQQTAEGQRVRAHHPCQSASAELKISSHLRQGDGDHRNVQDQHELSYPEQGQYSPACGDCCFRLPRTSTRTTHNSSKFEHVCSRYHNSNSTVQQEGFLNGKP